MSVIFNRFFKCFQNKNNFHLIIRFLELCLQLLCCKECKAMDSSDNFSLTTTIFLMPSSFYVSRKPLVYYEFSSRKNQVATLNLDQKLEFYWKDTRLLKRLFIFGFVLYVPLLILISILQQLLASLQYNSDFWSRFKVPISRIFEILSLLKFIIYHFLET